MILHNVTQGSGEWLQVRLGIPTASEFDKILTTTGKLSAQWEDYAAKLLAEKLLNRPCEEFSSQWTERGHDLEPQAVSFYEFQNECETVAIGFITDDARTMGASPDRLVGDDGLLEIKCPAPQTHMKYLMRQSVDKKYYPQIQGQLLVTGRAWVDIMSYHPELPPAIIRVERDADYLAAMQEAITDFTKKMADKYQQLIELGAIQQ